MELINSAINDTWKLCTLGGFLGLFFLTLLLTTNPQTVQISTSRNTVIAFISSDEPPATTTTVTVPAPAAAPVSTGAATDQTSYNIILTEPLNSTTTATAAHSPELSPTVEYEIPTNETKVIDQTFNTTEKVTVEYEIPTNETNSNSTAGQSPAPDPSPEFETPTNETNFNSTEFIQSLSNSNTTLEEKLFTWSTPETVVDSSGPTSQTVETGPTGNEKAVNGSDNKGGEVGQKCKLYEGRWVYKPEENPRYRVNQCPFLEEKMSCQKNGRPDFEYEAWSWESDDCQIPLFDAKDMLEKMRGKRMLIAGDSLNRNKWESLACLLYSSLSPKRVFVDAGGPAYKVLKALDYGFTLEFYWAPFLVHFNEKHKSGKKVVVLDELVPSSAQWRGADVMVFNSGHWWTHDRGLFKPYDVFEYKGEEIQVMKTELAYERALDTWADWLAHNVDPTKTKVYFRSISPEHKNKDWCYNNTRPIMDESYVQLYPHSMINVIESKLREINGRDDVHVNYLNITKMSTYRIDAHPGIFRFKHWKIITQKYKRLLQAKSDCSHWCLPGLPDTWNRILYASLFFDNFTPGELSIS